ncbi:MAG: MFS transporter [Gammaproteobacteria bacterium]
MSHPTAPNDSSAGLASGQQMPTPARQDRLATAIAAGTIGNILEWYDFALYGFMASVLSSLFFPSQDRLVSLIATYGVFAVGFIMRPLGSVLFGWLGDTVGRSRTLVLSVAMMAIPTVVLGLLPSYGMVGIAAPIALVVVRMVQGLSVGGEFSTSVTYLVETAPTERRGIFGSWANIGSLGGMLLGSAAAAAATNLLDQPDLVAWGWRLPFLFGGVLGVVALVMRKGLPESPQFLRYEQARCPNSPLKEAFVCNRIEMVQGALFAAAYGAIFYLALVYLPTWVSETAGIPLGTTMQVNTVTLAAVLPVIPLAGWLSDRHIRRTKLLAAAFALLGVAGAFLFAWMQVGGLAALIVGQIALGLILAVPLGVAPALFTELFPEEDRLTGYSIVFNAGLGVVGGLTPMLASWLILTTGSALAPVGVLASASALGTVALLWMRDRSREPLRTTCSTSIREAVMSADRFPSERWAS